ncbi:hypothetical protein E4U55_001278 [Claviceps digitariae]|nr:hypothetical protein E4U55_001278 [Claviceps digitariae]
MVALVDVSEAARERETFRYDSSLIQHTVPYSPNDPLFASRLRSSPDPALTSFAQLAVLRLKASRALISLFDTSNQYVVAEATPDLSLQPKCLAGNSLLCLSNTAIPRTYGICECVLTAAISPIHDVKAENGDETLPVSIINNLASDPRFADRPIMKSTWPTCRFYAAVPIRTNHGINIGVFCVVGDEPRDGLAADEVRFMWELSKVIMGHLESKRATKSHGRTERMIRGISSFIDGSTTLTKNKFDTLSGKDNNSHEAHPQDPQTCSIFTKGLQTALAADAEETKDSSDQDIGESPPRDEKTTSQIRDPRMSTASTGECVDENENDVAIRARKIYTKAAKALCSSLNVEGVIFLDANVTTFGGASARDFRNASATSCSSSSSSSSFSSSPASSSSDEPSYSGCHHGENCSRNGSSSSSESFAPVLGCSGASLSTIQDDSAPHKSLKLPQRFLRKLLRRYPNGTIFNFNQSGAVQSSDCSSEEASADPDISAATLKSHSKSASGKRPRMKQSEQEMLMTLLSGARCIAFAPVWDPSTQRWSAGTFAYTKASSRVFSTKVELSYLIAFGTIVISEVSRLKATLAQKSRMDMLSSLSHELRSPLHGVVLGVEMLHDSALDRFQRDVVHTIETCGRTLLDTVDHLLHWAKINNFNTKGLSRRVRASGDDDSKDDVRAERRRTCKSVEAGMMSITANVAVDELAEEVIESVFAGHTYQKLIAAHAAEASSSVQVEPNWTALRRLDSMHVSMDHAPMDSKPSDVVVSLDVEPNADWVFYTQAGALRRVIMNLLGNSLKYTARGFVRVTLSQQSISLPCAGRVRARRDLRTVCLTVSDSGKGISEEYLKSHLFVPFSQEDRLNPGVGLGLSLVKKIVSGLGGRIKVQSILGSGTTISVELPLEVAPSVQVPPMRVMSPNDEGDESETAPEDSFKRHVEMLSGLYVHVAGFPTHEESLSGIRDLEMPGIGKHFDERDTLVAICRDWLHMAVLDGSSDGHATRTKADVVICTAAHLDLMRRECREVLERAPVVVICSSVTAARTVESRYRNCSLDGVLEYSSQPLGPRKLARVLARSLERWNEHISRSTCAELINPDTLRQEQQYFDATVTRDQSLSEESPNDESPFDEAPHGKADAPTSPLSSRSSHTSCQEAVNFNAIKNSSSQSPPLSQSSSPLPSPLLLSPPPRNRFLLVDDNPINLKILSSCMKKMGHLHDAVCNGKEAVEAFRLGAGAYKCIFMDLSMPVMSGFEASCLIRQQEKEAKLEACTIVALTGLASAEAQREAFTCGIDLFLTKPVRFKELSQILTTKGLG